MCCKKEFSIKISKTKNTTACQYFRQGLGIQRMEKVEIFRSFIRSNAEKSDLKFPKVTAH